MEVFKWSLVILMVLDHVAYSFGIHPEWRFWARAVFPGFAALMGRALERGTPPSQYTARLIPFAIFSQIPYTLLFGGNLLWPLNVLFTFLSASLLRQRGYLGIPLGLLSEYPFGGIAIHIAQFSPLGAAVLIGLNSILFGWPLWVAPLQGGLFLALWYAVPHLPRKRYTPWWSFYAFYGLHLGILYLFRNVLP